MRLLILGCALVLFGTTAAANAEIRKDKVPSSRGMEYRIVRVEDGLTEVLFRVIPSDDLGKYSISQRSKNGMMHIIDPLTTKENGLQQLDQAFEKYQKGEDVEGFTEIQPGKSPAAVPKLTECSWRDSYQVSKAPGEIDVLSASCPSGAAVKVCSGWVNCKVSQGDAVKNIVRMAACKVREDGKCPGALECVHGLKTGKANVQDDPLSKRLRKLNENMMQKQQ